VIIALARAVIEEHPGVADRELIDILKDRCAREANLKYDTRACSVAIDEARKQLAHMRRRDAQQRGPTGITSKGGRVLRAHDHTAADFSRTRGGGK
jgi:hypothetical protein